MFVKMVGLYGERDDRSPAWYRKLGDCFDFVGDKKYATDLTEEQVKEIINSKEFYLRMFNAKDLIVEDEVAK